MARSLALAGVALALPLAVADAAHAIPPAPPVVLLAAGDVAGCNTTGDEATAAIVDGFPSALVAMLGDAAYPNGTLDDDETMVGATDTWPWTCYVLAEARDREGIAAVCGLLRELQADGVPLWKYLKVEARVGRPLFFAEP